MFNDKLDDVNMSIADDDESGDEVNVKEDRTLTPVAGCDASLLLDNSRGIVLENGSNANMNLARGFNVIDDIKSALEKECPQTVSCADILALAAKDSTILTIEKVPLGRRDSISASLCGSNNNIPAPNNTFDAILSRFKRQGLDLVDLVVLSGSQHNWKFKVYQL
ncbi:Peroxidase 72 [Capsicum baccatum]|uniref:peroxidase n=1 Tax=Capsicum baccatum TaxID=33114 RepID=A0A2G2WBK6_CAPBA|nr:Peroxidase 72 [Capsicum baccatum]